MTGASASPGIDAATDAKMRDTLAASGYDVHHVDSEDGKIEVYAMKNGRKLSLCLDDALNIMKTKED
ncbi:PepSY domain-containing protein [Salipiger pallidus]|nr:PepSY domain-containing protein [Salipiger pallidus]